MSSYRRYVARHGAAVHRAREMIRRHALETPPDPVTVAWTRDTFQNYARRLSQGQLAVNVEMTPGTQNLCMDLFKDPDPVLAYRGQRSGALRCLGCSGGYRKFSVPLTSEDLPDGGICRVCGVDVLIPVVPVPDPHCSLCKHAPHGGEAGCHCGCRGTR